MSDLRSTYLGTFVIQILFKDQLFIKCLASTENNSYKFCLLLYYQIFLNYIRVIEMENT